MNPRKTLEELAVSINVTLAQVLRLVVHLIYHHEGMVMYPLCATNVYMVAHDFDLAYLKPEHLADFQQEFPKHRLPGMFMNFSQPKRLSEHMNPLAHSQSAVEERLGMVQWLLQREMLALLQTYVFLQVGKEQIQRADVSKLDSTEGMVSPPRASDDDLGSSVPPSPQLAGTSPTRVRRDRYTSYTSTTSEAISEGSEVISSDGKPGTTAGQCDNSVPPFPLTMCPRTPMGTLLTSLP